MLDWPIHINIIIIITVIIFKDKTSMYLKFILKKAKNREIMLLKGQK